MGLLSNLSILVTLIFTLINLTIMVVGLVTRNKIKNERDTKLIIRGLIAIIDHDITGNSIDNLKVLKKELIEAL